jgi:hypothetical protein
MRRPITFAIAAGLMSLFGLIYWQGGIKPISPAGMREPIGLLAQAS